MSLQRILIQWCFSAQLYSQISIAHGVIQLMATVGFRTICLSDWTTPGWAQVSLPLLQLVIIPASNIR